MFSKTLSLQPQEIINQLHLILDPLSKRSIVDANLVEGVRIEAGKITVSLRVTEEKKDIYEFIRQEIHQKIKDFSGLENVYVMMTQHHKIEEKASFKAESDKIFLPEIKSIIAVASGKGGVGKSLVALNLALSLKRKGLKAGILDADIYGPSLPRMLDLSQKPDVNEQQKMIPLEKFGLQCMSMGFLIDEKTPVIWRGPMIQKSLIQFFQSVAWKALDVLVLDLPPGTGDVQLTLIQKIPLTGVVIVSTPQDLALLDARKGLSMFQKMQIPILGIVENMSFFMCPHCHKETDIFHHGTLEKEAKDLTVPFLGEIPLLVELRQSADAGIPFMEKYPDHPLAEKFLKIAENVIKQIETNSKNA